MAKSLLIKDTTVSERAQIVREALGADGDCEGIDLSDMYDDYIYGIKELADINREFSEKHAGNCCRRRTDGTARAEAMLALIMPSRDRRRPIGQHEDKHVFIIPNI